MELREIRVFLVLCEELHFGRTADRLHLTSSRVSQIVRDLEVKTGTTLFARTSRRVILTADGARLHDDLRPAVNLIDEALARARAAGGAITGTLRVGELFGAGGPRFVEIIGAFQELHPDCVVAVTEVPWTDALGPLLRREVELLAIRLPISRPNIVVGPVLSCQARVLAVARDHPLAARESVTLEDIADYRVARLDFLPRELIADLIPFETPSGRKIPRAREEIRTLGEVSTQVALGRIVHPTVEGFAERFGHRDFAYVPIVGPPPSRTALVWRSDAKDPRSNEFVRVAARVMDSETPAYATARSPEQQT